MNPVTLYRIDLARNMQRWYHLDVQPDLFGSHCLIREYGRIGSSGQVRMTPYPTEEAAQAAFMKQQETKERKGYAAT
ncbi:MAG TPA: WGR domain-containing protein [Ktedonosporobacter sp.]|jgi:predicted DNA-binding WGR domain protein|nr:WGR domain-containing protein [Ktedonosporobacter sp.]